MVADESSMGGVTTSCRTSKIPLFDPENLVCWKYAVESQFKIIGCLEIARGTETVVDIPESISAKEKKMVMKYNRLLQKRADEGFGFLVLTMNENPVFQSVISSYCEIGDLAKAWKLIWDKFDSKKPAMQSKLASDFSNAAQTTTVDAFINEIDIICSRMTEPPGDAMKKTQIAKGIDDIFYLFAQSEALKDCSWQEFCERVKDHAAQRSTRYKKGQLPGKGSISPERSSSC